MSIPSDLSQPSVGAESAARFADLRFLVVEDQGFQRWVAANMLSGLGARFVFSAPDGQAALDIYQEIDPPIDVIVSDLDMPGMDGMEFIRHVGEVGLPVSLIVVSGLDRSLLASVGTMARAYGVNLLGIIEKPATAKKLGALVRLHGVRPARPERPKALPEFAIEEISAGLARGEFEPFFQPKMEIATRAIKGAEAVARWRHPTKGVVGPQSFIAPLEKAGRIEVLTDIMLAKAAAACVTWQAAGFDAGVSVNLSLESLVDMTVADRVTDIVTGVGLSPRAVVLEVTESAAATNLGKVLENLSRLRMKGFGLSIDDYGTGYSSMQQLTRIPFTELKIDQSFVRNAATQEASRAMLESSLEMAAKLRISAVAEGVETQAQLDLLASLGCTQVQGYYVAHPMDLAGYLAWIREHRGA